MPRYLSDNFSADAKPGADGMSAIGTKRTSLVGGNVAASVRGDGTNPHTVEFGRLKAYTARTRGQTSLEFKNLTDKPEVGLFEANP